VLECSYDDLLRAIGRAADLDDVIAAHSSFLDTVVSRALLGADAQALRTQLRSICDLILQFQAAQVHQSLLHAWNL
jgi:gamma-tubulin complex component 3